MSTYNLRLIRFLRKIKEDAATLQDINILSVSQNNTGNTIVESTSVSDITTTVNAVSIMLDTETINGNTIWNSGNDGVGSGLNADFLDGYHESDFVRYTNRPVDFWSQGELDQAYAPIYNGWAGTAGSYYTSIYANGHRNSSNQFTYYGINGNLNTASGIDLSPSGHVYIRGGTASGSSLPINLTVEQSSITLHRNTTLSGTLVLSSTEQDTLNFTSNATNDNRGISFNSRTALTADYNDGWLRLNNQNEFTNGIFTPGNVRIDGSIYFSSTLYLDYPTGDYGTIQVNGSGKGNYEGYSIDGRAVFMHDGSSIMGLYDDVNNHWVLYHTMNGATSLYYDGSAKLSTYSSGVDVTGNLLADRVYPCYGDSSGIYLDYPTGNYGSIQINGSGKGNWEGFSIDGRFVFMHDGGDGGGIYNDVDNEWMFYGVRNSYTRMYHNGTSIIETASNCAKIGQQGINYNQVSGATSNRIAFRWVAPHFQGMVDNTGAIFTISSPSDYRIKLNVNNLENALDELMQYRPVTYNVAGSSKLYQGMIAHEVQEINSVLVEGEKDGIDDEGNPILQTIYYAGIVPLLIKSVQEQQQKITNLENEIQILKGQG